MPPKKQQKAKMSLNDFLGDSSLGSWADEMDSLPSAPAPRTDEERANERGGNRDFLSSRPDRGDRGPMPIRDEMPLPTRPPYTAFIGNLAFDLTDTELETFFAPHRTISVKIIKDGEGKPKGFGYVEFADLEGLKDALSRTGSNFSSRTIRVSVAEPPKGRDGGGGGGFGVDENDEKFANPWRRTGPLPDRSEPERDGGRRRFDAPSAEPSVSENISDWRSSRGPPRFPAEPEVPGVRRKGSGFSTPEGQPSAADMEEKWTIGGKFKPSAAAPEGAPGGRFGSMRGKGDMGPPPTESAIDEPSDWRNAARPRPVGRGSNSPTSSTPSTPQLSRRKLELLPRSAAPSAMPTPLSSPKSATNPVSSRANPFGAAKPVDVSAKENAVAERLAKEREERGANHTMSRESSRQATQRPPAIPSDDMKTPPNVSSSTPTSPSPGSPRLTAAASTVRPAISFAKAAAAAKAEENEELRTDEPKNEKQNGGDEAVADIAEKVTQVTV